MLPCEGVETWRKGAAGVEEADGAGEATVVAAVELGAEASLGGALVLVAGVKTPLPLADKVGLSEGDGLAGFDICDECCWGIGGLPGCCP